MNGEKDAWKHPVRKDWLKWSIIALYSIGFMGIISLFVFDVLSIHQEPLPILNSEAEHSQAGITQNKATLTTLVVAPIVSNPIIISIIKHIFYLLVWIFLFLLFPVAFTRLKRFKFFNFEFEVEKQEEKLINVLNVTTQKINFLSKWTTEEYANAFAMEAKDFNDVGKGIEIILGSLSKNYLDNWNVNVEYNVSLGSRFKSNSKIPKIVKNSYEAAQKRMEAIPINKENKDQIYIKNYLFTVVDYEDCEYAVVLTSYDMQFDEYDAVLLSGLVSLATQYFERTKMLTVLELMDIDEA